jgi:predicted RNase H-like HicB family nuclease
MRYELIIYWSKADGAFIVEVPELSGCMADGATYEEAVANAEVVIAEWIETTIPGPPDPRAAREAGICVRKY